MLGDDEEPDKDALYLAFKKHFMTLPELEDQRITVRRSLSNSEVHSYAWMYATAKAVVESQRREEQEEERDASQEPDARDPLTPAPVASGPRNPKNDPCPRMVSSDKCSFGDSCWFSHDEEKIAAERKKRNEEKGAKGKGKGKEEQKADLCRDFAKGNCRFGDRCRYSHAEEAADSEEEQNGTVEGAAAVAVVTESKGERMVKRAIEKQQWIKYDKLTKQQDELIKTMQELERY